MNTFQWERVAQEKLNVQKRVFFCFDSRHNMKYRSYLVEKLLQNIRIKCNHLQQFYPGWKDKAFPQPQRKIYLTWWWWLNKSLQISTMWLLFIMFHQKYKWNNQKRSTCFKRKKKTPRTTQELPQHPLYLSMETGKEDPQKWFIVASVHSATKTAILWNVHICSPRTSVGLLFFLTDSQTATEVSIRQSLSTVL